jgi:hypothetical protein
MGTTDKLDSTIRVGGVEYVQLQAVAGQPELDVTVTADATVAPRLRIGRIR